MTFEENIPFDLKDVRTVFYDLHDPAKLEAAQEELRLKAKAIEDSTQPIRNPITVARNVTLLQQSDDPETQAAGAVLEAVNDLRDEMRVLRYESLGSRHVVSAPEISLPDGISLPDAIVMLFERQPGEYTLAEIADKLAVSKTLARRRIQQLVEEGRLFEVGPGKFRTTPF